MKPRVKSLLPKWGILILLLIIGCKPKPVNIHTLGENKEIYCSNSVPFYIDYTNDFFLLNCLDLKNGAEHSALTFLINKNYQVKETIKSEDKIDVVGFIPILSVDKKLFSADNIVKQEKWKSAEVLNEQLVIKEVDLDTPKVFGLTGLVDDFIGRIGNVNYDIIGTELVAYSIKKEPLWSKDIGYSEGDWIGVFDNGIIYKPNRKIYYINSNDGSMKLLFDGDTIKKVANYPSVAGLVIYSFTESNLIFSIQTSDKPIYGIDLENCSLLWEEIIPSYFQIPQASWRIFNIPMLNTTYNGYTFIADKEHIFAFKNDKGLIKTHLLKDDKQAINFFMRNNLFHVVTNNGEIHIYNPEDLIH